MSVSTQFYKAGEALNSAPINGKARWLARLIKFTFGIGVVLITGAAIDVQVSGERGVTNMVFIAGFTASQLCFLCVIAYACVNR